MKISFIKEVFYTLLALAIVNLIISGINGLWQLPAEALLHTGVTVLALGMALLAKLFLIRHEILIFLNHYMCLPRAVRKPVSSFLLPRLKNHLEKCKLLVGDGIKIPEEELEELVEASFGGCRGSYQGTDRNPPSVLDRLYPTYIKQQVDRQRREPNCDSRFLLVSEADLQIDHQNNQRQFEKFVDDHSYTGTVLLQVEPTIAEEQANKYRLSSTDIGVFGWQFVVFYSPPPSVGGEYVVRVLPLSSDLKKKIAFYLIALNDVAKRINIVGNTLQLVNRRQEDVHAQRQRMFEHNDWPPGMRAHSTGK